MVPLPEIALVPVLTLPAPVRVAPVPMVRPKVSVSVAPVPASSIVPLVMLSTSLIVRSPLLAISSVWLALLIVIALAAVAVLLEFEYRRC